MIIRFPDVTVIGFLQTTYTTREGNGLLEICAAVLEPADPNLLDPSFTASIRLILNDGTAIGKPKPTCNQLFHTLSLPLSSQLLETI